MVFTSDHGEEFKEHGRFNHIQVYDELLHVPLLLYLPRTITMGIELKQRIDTQVRLIDLIPTLLELLEIPYNRDTIQGVSLTPILTGKSEKDRILYATKVSNPSGPPAKPRRETIRDVQYKLIHNPLQVHEQWELYDLENDQAEKHNIFDKESQNGVRLTQILENYIDENRTFKELMECQPVSSHFDDSTIEQLKELGYFQ